MIDLKITIKLKSKQCGTINFGYKQKVGIHDAVNINEVVHQSGRHAPNASAHPQGYRLAILNQNLLKTFATYATRNEATKYFFLFFKLTLACNLKTIHIKVDITMNKRVTPQP